VPGLFFIGGILLALLIGAAVVQHRKKVNAAWGTAADRLGLFHDPGGLFKGRSLQGTIDQQHVKVQIRTESHGKHSATYTCYDVSYPRPLGLGLKLGRQHFMSGVAKFFGAQDIEIGDPEFDREVVVKGVNEQRIAEYLTPSRRLSVTRLFHAMEGATIDDEKVAYRGKGAETDPTRLAARVRRLVNVSRALSVESSTVTPLDRAIDARREGRLDEALALVREQPTAGGAAAPPADAKLVEGEMLYAGREYEKAAEAFEQGRQAEPDDAELHEWAEQAGARAREPEPPSVSTSPDAREVCEALFDPSVLSLEANRRFEQRYQDAEVRWSGELTQATRYAFDLVFGNEPGTRAVLELHKLTGGPFGKTAQAVLQLPAGMDTELTARKGEEIWFEGRLVRCDAFMRNLFVAGARLI
jgi:hypothetical protein